MRACVLTCVACVSPSVSPTTSLIASIVTFTATTQSLPAGHDTHQGAHTVTGHRVHRVGTSH